MNVYTQQRVHCQGKTFLADVRQVTCGAVFHSNAVCHDWQQLLQGYGSWTPQDLQFYTGFYSSFVGSIIWEGRQSNMGVVYCRLKQQPRALLKLQNVEEKHTRRHASLLALKHTPFFHKKSSKNHTDTIVNNKLILFCLFLSCYLHRYLMCKLII